MKRTVLRYGIISAIVILALFLLELAIFSAKPNYEVQEVFGFAAMGISLLFVFFGIKHYRDRENGGRLSFGQGLKVGILIVLVPSLVFGLYNLLYVTVLNPDFVDTYYKYYLAEAQKTMTAAEFEKARPEMDAENAMFSNPLVGSLIMALMVFIIGVI